MILLKDAYFYSLNKGMEKLKKDRIAFKDMDIGNFIFNIHELHFLAYYCQYQRRVEQKVDYPEMKKTPNIYNVLKIMVVLRGSINLKKIKNNLPKELTYAMITAYEVLENSISLLQAAIISKDKRYISQASYLDMF